MPLVGVLQFGLTIDLFDLFRIALVNHITFYLERICKLAALHSERFRHQYEMFDLLIMR